MGWGYIKYTVLDSIKYLLKIYGPNLKVYGLEYESDRMFSFKRPYRSRKQAVYFRLEDRILSVRTV